MQISGLSASNTFSATDVLAIEVNVNGVNKTYKMTGATLATALASIGSYLKTTDVVNNLTSTSTTAPLSANMGKTLEEHIQQSTAKYIQHYNVNESNTLTIEVPTAYARANYIVLTPVGIATFVTDTSGGIKQVYDPSGLVASQSGNTIVVNMAGYYRGATIIGFA